MIRIVADTITGEIYEEKLTKAEIAEMAAIEAERVKAETEAETKRAEAIAKLETVGLTADDIRAILG